MTILVTGVNGQLGFDVVRKGLEMGLDIMTLKDLLGHAEIQSTLVYLHVSRIDKQLAFSPLDRLYKKK